VLIKPTKDDAALAVLAGVISGFGGCLSTVSTWVVEVGVGEQEEGAGRV
jgi:fluoride ion exporter CrcB/FEX